MTAAHRAMAQLETWPNLVSGAPRCAVGQAFSTTEYEVVHFHSDHAADLHLTHPAIERLLPELRRSSAIRVMPGSAWLTVLLDCDADVELLLSLISVALKAHGDVRQRHPGAPCEWYGPPVVSPRAAVEAVAVAAPTPAPQGLMPAARRAMGRFIPHAHRPG
ncbi:MULTISPECIES: luciferase family protein [unclassified Streptomyces]|uniref:luciferase domain-containing protein n=1 Tax=unclassified Streptomyces TaxID=2593676 RepID=UPI00340D6A16